MKDRIIEIIEKNKIITIVRGVAEDKLIPLAEAMHKGGIRLMECTFAADGKIPDEEVAGYIEKLSSHFGDEMAIGAGTVLTEKQVELTHKAGGGFIISPDTNAEVIRRTNELGLVSIPGAITPTEVATAHRLGADFVKLFPIDLYGPKYVRTLRAPLSNVRVLAVNGITAENMGEYLDAGASGVGVGSGIVNKKLIDAGDFEGITELARKYVREI